IRRIRVGNLYRKRNKKRGKKMSEINLREILARYSKALDARPSKGEWTTDQVAIVADSACDVPDLVKALEEAEKELRHRELHHFEVEQENAELKAQIERVRELHKKVPVYDSDDTCKNADENHIDERHSESEQ